MATIYAHMNKPTEQTVIQIDSLESFLNVVNSYLKNNEYIFRGISKEDEKYPKIIRENRAFSDEREDRLLKEFEKYCGLYGGARDCWDFLALAQHHGLETRLIDFSNNPFVATFFSLHNQSAAEYIVYVANKRDYKNVKQVDFSSFNGVFYGNLSEMSFADRIRHNYSFLIRGCATVVFEPNYANERVFAQKGLFLIPPFIDKEIIDTLYSKMPIKLVINKSIREEILDYLAQNNFDEFHLMPDLSSACFEINNSIK